MNELSNEFSTEVRTQSVDIRTQGVVTRAQKEIEGSIVLAKKFPRDEQQGYARIISACKRTGMAEKAVYAYKRGGEMVEGPSIRLAEVAARAWGNLDFGLRELERDSQKSLVEAYCWDLETNVKRRLEFEVQLARHTKKGVVWLESDRDIYEHIANFGARRMRQCILAVIPDDVISDAMTQCKETIAKGYKGDTKKDAIKKMVVAFDEIGITADQIRKYLGISDINGAHENQLVKLRQIYASLKDGVSSPGEWFEMPSAGEVIAKEAEHASISDMKRDLLLDLDVIESTLGKTSKEITGTDLRAKIESSNNLKELSSIKIVMVELSRG
jgi:hypothetical protein